MSKVARAQLAVILGGVALLELLTRVGVIGRLTMIPPSEMAAHLWIMLEAGELNASMTQTFANVAIAFALAVSIGCLAGVAIHRLPRLRTSRPAHRGSPAACALRAPSSRRDRTSRRCATTAGFSRPAG